MIKLKSEMDVLNFEKGFTLIEMLIYIGLLSLVMGAVLVGTYQLIESTDKTQAKSYVQGEAQFVLSKIDEAMNGATVISGSGASVTITNPSLPAGESPIVFNYDSSNKILTLQRGSGSPVVLNGDIAPITSLTFTPSGTPTKLNTTFVVTNTLYTDTFTSSKVIRN